MLVLNVTYHVKPGMRAAYVDALKKNQVAEQCRMEAGSLQYDFYMPIDEQDTDTLFLLERYADDEALAFHKAQDYFKHLQEIKAEYVESTDVQSYKA